MPSRVLTPVILCLLTACAGTAPVDLTPVADATATADIAIPHDIHHDTKDTATPTDIANPTDV